MRRIVLGVLVLALSACGFHLRGEAKLAPSLSTLKLVIADPNSPLGRDLESALERAGVRLSESDSATLKIGTVQLVTEPLTVGPRARVQEYRIRYKIALEVTGAAGTALLPNTPIELTRDYSFDETQALGAQAEEELLKKELERDMVQQILRRLAAVKTL